MIVRWDAEENLLDDLVRQQRWHAVSTSRSRKLKSVLPLLREGKPGAVSAWIEDPFHFLWGPQA